MVDVTLTAEELRAALPDVSTPLRLKGLEGRVRVYRDAFGIPHVRAQSTHDAFFGQGFVTAQDRLWQMEYDRRRAYGDGLSSPGRRPWNRTPRCAASSCCRAYKTTTRQSTPRPGRCWTRMRQA